MQFISRLIKHLGVFGTGLLIVFLCYLLLSCLLPAHFLPAPWDWSLMDSSLDNPAPPLSIGHANNHKSLHLLGTDLYGRDILAGILHGFSSALVIGVGSVILALCIGLFLGSTGSYLSDRNWSITPLRILIIAILMVLCWYVGFIFLGSGGLLSTFLLWVGISVVGITGILLLGQWQGIGWRMPMDTIFQFPVIVLDAIPPLLLLILCAALLPQRNIMTLILLIGIIKSPDMIRLVRHEMLRVRTLDYIKVVRISGMSHWRIWWKHALPNVLLPLTMHLAQAVGSAILMESTLTFLGIGMPAGSMTWGSMLQSARRMPDAWWLAFFPGLAIFLLVWASYLIAERFRQKLYPQLQNR